MRGTLREEIVNVFQPVIRSVHAGKTVAMLWQRLWWRIFEAQRGWSLLKEEHAWITTKNCTSRLSYVIYNGLDLTHSKNLARYGMFRDQYDIRGTMILCLGRINESKGIRHILAAFAHLLPKITDGSLVITGSIMATSAWKKPSEVMSRGPEQLSQECKMVPTEAD